MSSELQTVVDGQTVERVLLDGDLGKLTASQRVAYYGKICEALGLNPLTRPFEYIVLNGRLVLYARRECTEQLRKIYKVSLSIVARELTEDLYAVTAKAQLPDGRTDESIGVKSLAGLKGDARANAMMTAETKSKRRVTLSICGLGMLDELEVESLPPSIAYHVEPTIEPAIGPAIAGETAQDTVQQPAPRPELPAGAVRIEKINAVKTKNPKVLKYFITLSTGEEASTINSRLAGVAEAVCEANEPVVVVLKATKWGSEVESIKRLETNDQQPELGMLDEDEIPF